MNRTIWLAILGLLAATASMGQNFREWFRQKKTQQQYLTEQIAQLKIYLELTEKGYKIAKEGLTTIGEIKRGEFKLHQNRFDSLLIVNVHIGSYSRLQQITDLHGRINQICKALPPELAAVSDADQLNYFMQVLDAVYQDCQSILGNLFMVIRSGQAAMSDDERITRIELCLTQMQANYSFVKNFDQQAKLLARQSGIEKSEISNQKTIHGIK